MLSTRTRLTASFGLVLSALLSAPVVTVGSETAEGAETGAPATVTGTATAVRPNQPPTVHTGEPPVISVTQDYGWTMRWETDDPRLSGEFETNQNVYLYSAFVALRNGIGRLTNGGGSWIAEFQGFTHGGFPNNYYVNYLVGEGGYEGLTAIVLTLPAPGAWQLTGVIAPGPLPEPPEWVLPPNE